MNLQATIYKVIRVVIPVIIFLGISMFPIRANSQASGMDNGGLGYQSDSRYHYQVVKRPDVIIGPRIGVVITEDGYAAELGLYGINISASRPVGLTLSYVSPVHNQLAPVADTDEFDDPRFGHISFRESIREVDTRRMGIRGTLNIPVSAAWMITVGGGADYVNKETNETNIVYRSETNQQTPDPNLRTILGQSSKMSTDNYWDPVISIGFETFSGRIFNAGTYAVTRPVEDFYNHIHVGVYATFNIAGF